MDPAERLRLLRTRLLASPRPGAWLGLVIRAFPGADDDGPPHWLVAGWAPAPSGLYRRLPEFAAIASPDRDRALAELFVHLPPDAAVHPVTSEHVDTALVAGMVLAVDRNLSDWHRAGLRAFVETQRAADLERIRARYTDREEGFERLKRSVSGDAADEGEAG